MATYNFYLKKKGTDRNPIILQVCYGSNKVRFYTGESINPIHWNKNTQRAKQSASFSEHPEFNQRLENIKTSASNVFRKYKNDNNHTEPSISEFKKLLEVEIKGTKTGIPATFIEFAEYFIKQTETRLQAEKKINSRSDISGSYNQTLTVIKDFAKAKNRRIDFDNIDLEFEADFKAYMETNKKFSYNTIGKHVKNLKRILNEASLPEININRFTYYKRFKVYASEVDSIYLNESELQAMYELDLSQNSRLDKCRDLFMLASWTGLRFSDFTTIKPENIHDDLIHVKTQKTGKRVAIPLHPIVRSIIKKYEGLPPGISNVKMNLYLKEIGEMIKLLHEKITIKKIKSGMSIENKILKYKLLTCHTARRSFASNLYLQGVPMLTIMQITGHTTPKSFMRYIKIDEIDHAKILQKHFQKAQLKVVS